jgi:hypothetical protein
MALDTISMLQDTVSVLQDRVSVLQDTKCLTVTLKNDNSESMTFAVPGYQKMEEAGATFTSTPFYTHPNGYLMKVENGCSMGFLMSRVEASIRVLTGKHDTQLKWPFRGKVKIELLNQLADSDHITQTVGVVLHEDEQTRHRQHSTRLQPGNEHPVPHGRHSVLQSISGSGWAKALAEMHSKVNRSYA